MRKLVATLVHDYGWIHLGLGLAGNTLFLTGSVLFLPRFSRENTAVWLFIGGATLMLVGALGRLLVEVLEEASQG